MKSHERPVSETRICTRCGEVRQASDFYTRKRRGELTLFAECKPCYLARSKERYARNRDAILARNKNRQQEKAAEIAECQKRWYEANRERVLEQQRAYNARPDVKERERKRQAERYAKNREAIRAKQRARSADPEYRERVKERSRKHYQANPEHYVAKAGARRAARVRATPMWYELGDAKPFYKEARRLTRLTGIRHVVDHIIPLQGKNVCGLHCKENLQVIPEAVNLSKFNKFG